MEPTAFPVNLYCDEADRVETSELTRSDEDFRVVRFVTAGSRRLVIKHCSNPFSTPERIEGWFRLMREYRELGIPCPSPVPNRNGELLYSYQEDGRQFCVFAETFASCRTAEQLNMSIPRDRFGNPGYLPELMRSVGTVAAAHLSSTPWPSGYCLLEPFSSLDESDETTLCCREFTARLREEYPALAGRADALQELFFRNQEALRAVYSGLPTSCFQGDLCDRNILLDRQYRFAGLIDFNLCGQEPILNYTVREALWNLPDSRLYSAAGNRLYYYDAGLDDLRMSLFFRNLRCVAENYRFTPEERNVFPVLMRYLNSYWWHQTDELELIRGRPERAAQILNWLERQMTRRDLQLP